MSCPLSECVVPMLPTSPIEMLEPSLTGRYWGTYSVCGGLTRIATGSMQRGVHHQQPVARQRVQTRSELTRDAAVRHGRVTCDRDARSVAVVQRRLIVDDPRVLQVGCQPWRLRPDGGRDADKSRLITIIVVIIIRSDLHQGRRAWNVWHTITLARLLCM